MYWNSVEDTNPLISPLQWSPLDQRWTLGGYDKLDRTREYQFNPEISLSDILSPAGGGRGWFLSYHFSKTFCLSKKTIILIE